MSPARRGRCRRLRQRDAQRQRHGQRGVAILAATLALLVAMSVTAAFVHRSLMFEQRSTSNQYRADSAFETAQAGLDWTLALVNDARGIDDRCLPSAAGPSFRDRFLKPDSAQRFAPDLAARPGCVLERSGLRCDCGLVPTNAPAAGTSDGARFTVRLEPVSGDPFGVLVTSWGCTSTVTACDDGSTPPASSAVAKVVASLKLLKPSPPPRGGAVAPAAATAPAAQPASAPGVMVPVAGSWHDY